MKKVIVIDDEEDIRFVLGEVLKRAGFDVRLAPDAATGLDQLREQSADVVITDIIMPGKDGVETVYDIRMEFPNTKIIVISGGGNVTPLDYEPDSIKTSAYLASATEAGADMTLTKPFDRADIVAAVTELIGD